MNLFMLKFDKLKSSIGILKPCTGEKFDDRDISNLPGTMGNVIKLSDFKIEY